MPIDVNLIPIFAIAVGLIITVTAILSDTISKTKLKTEQIRADALVRAEEVRARNQIELEMLMRQEERPTVVTNSGEPAQHYAHRPAQHGAQTPTQYNEDYSGKRNRIRE